MFGSPLCIVQEGGGGGAPIKQLRGYTSESLNLIRKAESNLGVAQSIEITFFKRIQIRAKIILIMSLAFKCHYRDFLSINFQQNNFFF